MKKYDFHAAANIFPLADGPELDALAEDIKRNGQHHAIVLHEDRILDGRRRYLACDKGGVSPKFLVWDGKGSPVDYVASVNVHRRHLTASQRAIVGLKTLPLLETEAKERQRLSKGRGKKGTQDCATSKGKVTEHAAKLVGCSSRMIEMAKKLQAVSPELIDQIERGETTISMAFSLAGLSQDKPNGTGPDDFTAEVDLFHGDALGVLGTDGKASPPHTAGKGDPALAEYATPDWLFNQLNEEFDFGLDAAASDADSAKCAPFYTPEVDGLKQDWATDSEGKSIFCNPPWSFDSLKAWVTKGFEESRKDVTVVMVIPTGPWYCRKNWYRHLVMGFSECRMVQSGVDYVGFGSKKGKTLTGYTIQTMIVIFRPGQNGSFNGPYIDQPGKEPPAPPIELPLSQPKFLVGWDEAGEVEKNPATEALVPPIASSPSQPKFLAPPIDEQSVLKQARDIKRRKRDKIRAAAQAIQDEALRRLPEGERLWKITTAQDVVRCKALVTDPPYGVGKYPWQPDTLQGLETFTRDWSGRWNACQADFAVIFWGDKWLFEAKNWLDESLSAYKYVQLLHVTFTNNAVDLGTNQQFRYNNQWAYFYRRKGCTTPVNGGARSSMSFCKPQTNYKADQIRQHPCQQPVEVYEDWLIPALSNPGDLIADPFAGSGTTGVAAVRTNRRWHGIETDPEHFKTAEGRIAAYGERQLPM